MAHYVPFLHGLAFKKIFINREQIIHQSKRLACSHLLDILLIEQGTYVQELY